jgi:TorA maturation chaperone TorD
VNPAAELARLRQGLYRYFAGALAPPEPAHLADLRAASEYLAAMDLASYGFFREWETFATCLAGDGFGPELSTEYVRLFASGTRGVLCPPVESHYRAEGRREAVATILGAIEQDYRELGITVTGTRDPSDHVVTQLEIMSMLCARESSCWADTLVREAEQLLDTETTFLRRHLAAWVPEWRNLVLASDASEFYRTLVDALHAFIVHDRDLAPGLRQWTGADA